MESKKVYKKKSSYKKRERLSKVSLPLGRAKKAKETGARLVNIEESEIESPQHRDICSNNIVEPADVSGRKLGGK